MTLASQFIKHPLALFGKSASCSLVAKALDPFVVIYRLDGDYPGAKFPLARYIFSDYSEAITFGRGVNHSRQEIDPANWGNDHV